MKYDLEELDGFASKIKEVGIIDVGIKIIVQEDKETKKLSAYAVLTACQSQQPPLAEIPYYYQELIGVDTEMAKLDKLITDRQKEIIASLQSQCPDAKLYAGKITPG